MELELQTANESTKRSHAADVLEYYRMMLLIRRFEERAGQMYGAGLIGGFCHLYIGQELIAVGMRAGRGMSPRSVMAELSRRPFANAANGK